MAEAVYQSNLGEAQRLIIKGCAFGEGESVLCVPVMEKTEAEIQKAVKELIALKAPMIEWRMDGYEGVEDPIRLSALLKELQTLTKATVFLATFRSEAQGGQKDISEEDYLALLWQLAESEAVDVIDLELTEVEEPAYQIEKLQACGKRVMASYHDFHATPKMYVMREQLFSMKKSGADFIKLAVMPRHKTDVLALMEAVVRTKEEAPDSRVVAVSMGEEGSLTRIAGGWFGSCISFASYGKGTAPGQMSYERMKRILDEL